MTATMIIIQAGASQIYIEVDLNAVEPAYHVIAVSNMQALFSASSSMCKTFNASSPMIKTVQFTER